jgi:hypothetical protein
LGVWAWGLGPHPPIPNPQSPIPNPQSPFNNLKKIKKFELILKINKINNINKYIYIFIHLKIINKKV